MYSVHFGFSFRCKKWLSFAEFTTHLLLASFCFCIWTLCWTSCTRILHRVCVLGTSPPKQNSVEIFRLFFSNSLFALFCGSCGCRSLPISSKSGEGNKHGCLCLVLLSATLCTSMPSQVFNILSNGICDLLRYVAILVESNRNQKLKQHS